MTDSMEVDQPLNSTPTNFLSLPYEIRLQIYELLFKDINSMPHIYDSYNSCFYLNQAGRRPRWVTPPRPGIAEFSKQFPGFFYSVVGSDFQPFPPMLLANKQISHEVQIILYRETAIQCRDLMRYFGEPKDENLADPSASKKRGKDGKNNKKESATSSSSKATTVMTTTPMTGMMKASRDMACQLGLSNMNPNMLKFTFIRSFNIGIPGYWDYEYDLSWIFRDLADLQDGLIARYGPTSSSPAELGLPLRELILDFRENSYVNIKYTHYKHCLSNFFCRKTKNGTQFPIPHVQRLRGLTSFKIGRWEATDFQTPLWTMVERAFRERNGKYCNLEELQQAIRDTHAIVTAPHGDETAAALAAQLVVEKPSAKKRKTAKGKND